MTLQKSTKIGMALGVAATATVGYLSRKDIRRRINKVIKRESPVEMRFEKLAHPTTLEEGKMVDEGAVGNIQNVNRIREKEKAK